MKLLIKHGVDVNKRVVGDFTIAEQTRTKDEAKKERRKKAHHEKLQKQFNPQNGNPESK